MNSLLLHEDQLVLDNSIPSSVPTMIRMQKYSAKFKFQVILELLQGEKTAAQVVKDYGIHPNTLGNWIRYFLRNGDKLFFHEELITGYERRVAELEVRLGKKESEITHLHNLLSHSQVSDPR